MFALDVHMQKSMKKITKSRWPDKGLGRSRDEQIPKKRVSFLVKHCCSLKASTCDVKCNKVLFHFVTDGLNQRPLWLISKAHWGSEGGWKGGRVRMRDGTGLVSPLKFARVDLAPTRLTFNKVHC